MYCMLCVCWGPPCRQQPCARSRHFTISIGMATVPAACGPRRESTEHPVETLYRYCSVGIRRSGCVRFIVLVLVRMVSQMPAYPWTGCCITTSIVSTRSMYIYGMDTTTCHECGLLLRSYCIIEHQIPCYDFDSKEYRHISESHICGVLC